MALNSNDDLLTLCKHSFPDFIKPLNDLGIISLRSFLSIIDNPLSLRTWMASRMYKGDSLPINMDDRNDFVEYVKLYCSNNGLTPNLVTGPLDSFGVLQSPSDHNSTIANFECLASGGKAIVIESLAMASENIDGNLSFNSAGFGSFLPVANSTLQAEKNSLTTSFEISTSNLDSKVMFHNKQIYYFVNPNPSRPSNKVAILSNGDCNWLLFDFEKSKWEMSPEEVVSDWINDEEEWYRKNTEKEWPLPIDFMDKVKYFIKEIVKRLDDLFPYEIREDILVGICAQLCDNRSDLISLDALYQRWKSEFPKHNDYVNIEYMTYKLKNKFKYKGQQLRKFDFYPESKRSLKKNESQSNSKDLNSDSSTNSKGKSKEERFSKSKLLKIFPYDQIITKIKEIYCSFCASEETLAKERKEQKEINQKLQEETEKKRKATEEAMKKPNKKSKK